MGASIFTLDQKLIPKNYPRCRATAGSVPAFSLTAVYQGESTPELVAVQAIGHPLKEDFYLDRSHDRKTQGVLAK
jgi:hypothetical protein